MITESLITLFKRDLNALNKEVSLYKDTSNLWIIDEDISNSAGSLCLHLVGNLNHFIGSVLGNTGYVRQRDLEFSLKDVSKEDLKIQVDDTIRMVEKALHGLTPEELEKEYPIQAFEKPMTTSYFLMHLVMHLSYHLGQINYHRRLLDKHQGI